jgi:hypothetical protein
MWERFSIDKLKLGFSSVQQVIVIFIYNWCYKGIFITLLRIEGAGTPDVTDYKEDS